MAPYRKALLALSLSDADSGLIEYAAMLSGLQTIDEIDVVHVLAEPGLDVREKMERAVRGRLAAQFHVLQGERTDQLLQFCSERHTEVVLLGHEASHNPRRSLARRLAMKAPCSVWLVPDGSPAKLTRIVAPVDLSGHSADSLKEAVSIAKQAGIRQITALHVYFDSTVVTYADQEARMRGRDQHALSRFLGEIDHSGIDIVPENAEGPSVSHAIHRVCQQQGADLIVMGTRGRSRAASVLLGSETEQTLMETKIPIVAVKHFGASRKLLEVLFNHRTWERNEPRFG